MKRGNNRISPFWLLAVIAASISLYVYTLNNPDKQIVLIDRSLARVFFSVELLVSNVASKITNAGAEYSSLKNAQLENAYLKKRIEELKHENGRMKETLNRLSDLMPVKEYAEKLKFETIPAMVTTAPLSASNWVITINKGEKDGVKPNMGVITQEGVVGVISKVFPTSSLVQLIVDRSGAVDAAIPETKVRGIVRGLGSKTVLRCFFSFVEHGAEIKDGQTLLTSGLDQRFPPGIPIGTVHTFAGFFSEEVENYDVAPFVDFKLLRTVLVITGAKW